MFYLLLVYVCVCVLFISQQIPSDFGVVLLIILKLQQVPLVILLD